MVAENSDGLERCAHCGSTLPTGVWCPIVTTTTDDGSIRLHSFCDEDCEDAWAAATDG